MNPAKISNEIFHFYRPCNLYFLSYSDMHANTFCECMGMDPYSGGKFYNYDSDISMDEEEEKVMKHLSLDKSLGSDSLSNFFHFYVLFFFFFFHKILLWRLSVVWKQYYG